MSGFYHFVPADPARLFDGPKLRPAALEKFGLAGVLADLEREGEHYTQALVEHGPDGKRGTLITPRPAHGDYPTLLGYVPAKQTWAAVPSRDGTRDDGTSGLRHDARLPLRYLGWLTDEPPTPEGLERRQTFAGYLLTDEHGQAWSVPIARAKQGALGTLPRDVFFNVDGEPQSRLKPQFDALWEVAGMAWDWFNLPADEQSPGVRAIGDAWLAKAALQALAVNYRLGPQELTCLYELGRGVLDDRFIVRVLRALIDFEFVAEFQKKETPAASAGDHASSPLTPGGAAGSLSTVPPGASSA